MWLIRHHKLACYTITLNKISSISSPSQRAGPDKGNWYRLSYRPVAWSATVWKSPHNMRQIIQKSQERGNRTWTEEAEMMCSCRIGYAPKILSASSSMPESQGLDFRTEVFNSSWIWTPDHDSLIQRLEKPQPQDQRTTRLVKGLAWTEAPPQGMKKRNLPKVPEHRTSLRSI